MTLRRPVGVAGVGPAVVVLKLTPSRNGPLWRRVWRVQMTANGGCLQERSYAKSLANSARVAGVRPARWL
jgi:hypothetical protein